MRGLQEFLQPPVEPNAAGNKAGPSGNKTMEEGDRLRMIRGRQDRLGEVKEEGGRPSQDIVCVVCGK